MTDFFSGESEWGRSFVCGWAPRREGVLKLAARLKAMAIALEDIQPGLGRLWPQFALRPMRPGDPGYLLDCPTENLARLLDRRARSAPPQLPAPVGPEGYRVVLAGWYKDKMNMSCGANIHVDSDLHSLDQPVDLSIDRDSPIWRNAETARRIHLALVDAWDAEWAVVGTRIDLDRDDDDQLISEEKPWMVWVAPRVEIAAFRVKDAGAPLLVEAVRGGVLRTWPWLAPSSEPPEQKPSA